MKSEVKEIKTVLLIEDMDFLQNLIADIIHRHMGKDVNVLFAGTVTEAETIFNTHQGVIDLILMDTNLGRGETTFELASKISKVFPHHIVAISTDPDNHKGMILAGCTDSCLKEELAKYIKERRFAEKKAMKK